MLFSDNFFRCISLYTKMGGEVSPGTTKKISQELLKMAPGINWSDPNITFVDPSFSNAMNIIAVIEKLFIGLEEVFPDPKERIKHILTKQVWGFEKNYAPFMLATNIIEKYFDISSLDIKLNLYNTDLLKQGEVDMKFNYWVLNPPYQEKTTDLTPQAKDIYDKFIDMAANNAISGVLAITPSRFLTKDSQKKFKKRFINDYGLKSICLTDNNRLFETVDVKGGLCYFYLEKDYNGNVLVEFRDSSNNFISSNVVDLKSDNGEFLVSRNTLAQQVLKKVCGASSLKEKLKSQSHFGIKTNDSRFGKGSVNCLVSKEKSKKMGGQDQFLPVEEILVSKKDGFDKYKVAHRAADGKGRDYTNFYKILSPREVCSESFVCFVFDDKQQAENYVTYFNTKLFKFLFMLGKTKQHITKNVFQYVPDQDFSNQFSDEELYEKYSLTEEEIQYIEGLIP